MAQDDIQGQVVDPSGNPVSGAIVELTKSFESNPVEKQTVLRTTTDSNGNYIFESHPDGDGTTQDYHVSCYNHDGSAYVNSFNNPGVTADLRESFIPDVSVYIEEGSGTFTRLTDRLRFNVESPEDGEIAVGTISSAIDLTDVETIFIDHSHSSSSSNNQDVSYIGVDKTLSKINRQNTEVEQNVAASLAFRDTNFSRRVDSFSVSSLSGTYNLGMGAQTSSSNEEIVEVDVFDVFGLNSSGQTVFEIAIPG